MKTAFAALVAVLALSSAASACERHQEHVGTTALEAVIVVPPPPMPRAVAEDELVPAQSQPAMTMSPMEAWGGGCMRDKEQTVYLTQ